MFRIIIFLCYNYYGGNMIEMIEIIINNGIFSGVNALVSYKYNYCIYNEHKYNIDDEFKENIVRIIRLWKHEYGSSKDIDAEEFSVIVTTTDGEKESFHGKGIFPRGYRELIKMLGDLDD